MLHPDFRAELLAVAKGRRFVLPDQVVPRARSPRSEERRERTPSGAELIIRPARITDERALPALAWNVEC